MAYTIKLNDCDDVFLACKVRTKILRAINKDGRFCVGGFSELENLNAGPREGSRKLGVALKFRNIRLTERKPYCGNHPGPCVLGGKKKPNSFRMEWDDWVAFHKLVNDSLNRCWPDTDVWTLPQDVSGRFWIRKGKFPRICFDYDEQPTTSVFPLRVWNKGTADQFERRDEIPI